MSYGESPVLKEKSSLSRGCVFPWFSSLSITGPERTQRQCFDFQFPVVPSMERILDSVDVHKCSGLFFPV